MMSLFNSQYRHCFLFLNNEEMTVLYENSVTLLFTQTEYILRVHANF